MKKKRQFKRFACIIGPRKKQFRGTMKVKYINTKRGRIRVYDFPSERLRSMEIESTPAPANGSIKPLN